jgi:FtsH-binding integral membrane protein
VEQTSETLDMLERIAALQQQQVEHQARQFLTETRSLFFAFLVSVAVIVAGVAPLVEAEPYERLQILLWTLVAVAAAGLVYVVVRGRQSKK